VNIKERIDQILGGKYRIEGFGKAILTCFLMDYNPDKYCLWNNKTERGFSVIGWEVYENRDSQGAAYQKVLKVLQKLRGLRPELNLTFDDIDLFLHTISAEDDGRNAVRAIIEGREISKPMKEVEQTLQEVKNMEFAMERYLEEFIETNFDKINFGANLELYQDEENNGRQSSIGNIDLLAVNKEKDERLQYALKLVPNVDLFIYNVSFDIKKSI